MSNEVLVVIGFSAVGSWSALHVARRMLDRHKPRRPGYLLGGSNKPPASTTMRAVGMRSQIGAVARLPITVDSKSTCVPGGRSRRTGFQMIPQRPLHLSNLSSRTAFGFLMDDDGAVLSGHALAPLADSRNPVAELWGDFEWDDAA